jgi:hypothetical protein
LQLFTKLGRFRVAKWALQSADDYKPQQSKSNTAISDKVRAKLRTRHVSNKKRTYGTGCVRLNAAESRAVNSSGTLPHTFFSHYLAWYRAKGVVIELGLDRAQELKMCGGLAG